MEIKLNKIKIKDIVKNFQDSDEEGILGFDRKLNIRPKYKREYVYNDEKRNEVIKTINKGLPLNIMYWIKNSNSSFELLDGQQRTLSFCHYINGDFSVNGKIFNNLTEIEKYKILNYELDIYFCEGNDKEKLDLFKIINISGEKLTNQEIRNAIYAGEWLTDVNKKFSKTNCPTYHLANKYILGSQIRQKVLEKAIKWIANNNKEQLKGYKNKIEDYMSIHQKDKDCSEIWLYFQNVINWVEKTFITYRKKEMRGLEWGFLYNKYHNNKLNPNEIEIRIKKLMEDEEIEDKKSIYNYILSSNPSSLKIKKFSDSQKRSIYELQNGKCKICNKNFDIGQMKGDHIILWSAGGKTINSNCQMLCISCNRKKYNK
ncbi:MAG: HNH endonuclease family protein [Metamycoplasmataceae bacterium]